MTGSRSVSVGQNQPDAQVVLTIQEASQLLQVPAPTIRSWERRYGIPMAGRSNGGHRRYTPEQMQMLNRMRDEISRGRPAREAAAFVRASQTLPADPLRAAGPSHPGSGVHGRPSYPSRNGLPNPRSPHSGRLVGRSRPGNETRGGHRRLPPVSGPPFSDRSTSLSTTAGHRSLLRRQRFPDPTISSGRSGDLPGKQSLPSC